MTNLEKAEEAIEKIGRETWETCDYMDGLRDYIRLQAKKMDAIVEACAEPSHDEERWRALDVHNAIKEIMES